jgi:hypothetical protein
MGCFIAYPALVTGVDKEPGLQTGVSLLRLSSPVGLSERFGFNLTYSSPFGAVIVRLGVFYW